MRARRIRWGLSVDLHKQFMHVGSRVCGPMGTSGLLIMKVFVVGGFCLFVCFLGGGRAGVSFFLLLLLLFLCCLMSSDVG